MEYEKVKAAFRFVGDNVDPMALTQRIGIQPSTAHAKGDSVEKHPERTYPTGYWGLDSFAPPDGSLEEHLKYLLDILEPQASIIKEFTSVELVPNFYCGIFTTEADFGTCIKLEPDTLGRIAYIGASLELHIYCCGEEEQESPK